MLDIRSATEADVPAPLVGLTHLRALAITLVFVYHYRLFEHPAWVERVGAFRLDRRRPVSSS